ncbi:MAG TPA: response regulator transcription factor [Candidatus Acidoferrales bacterium]|nr:response regulator transcription factor [Candidatus Acidoferrales bacterium]
MSERSSMVFVVDDDASVREAVGNLLESVGVRSESFASAEEFLHARRPDEPSCLLLDVRLPGLNGLEFQEVLHKAGIRIPIVFITAHGEVPMASRAMKAGAVDFLTKPFQKQELLTAVHQAIDRDRVARKAEAAISRVRSKWEKLTPREREVMDLVVAGLMNKEIAAKLGVTEITVKVHRGRVMEKMEADSLPELVRMSERLKSAPRA